MNLRYSVASMVLLAMCFGLGCSKERTLEDPPKPGKDAQVVYHSMGIKAGVGLSDYTLSPAERDAMIAVLASGPDARFADRPVLPAIPTGLLNVGGQYQYRLNLSVISFVYSSDGRESGYCWQRDHIAALGKRLYEATADQDIRDAFAEFAKAQIGEAGTRPTQPDRGSDSRDAR